jgi:integrase
MESPKPEKKAERKVVEVTYHGHSWKVYPLKCRDKDIFRVFHRVNGERSPRTFTTLAKAKADARSILKEIYAKGDSKIHLTDDDKLDWKSATSVLKQAGIKASLTTVCRHYSDLAHIVGGAKLLTDVARKYADSHGEEVTPINVSTLRDDYLASLKKKGLSVRHVDAQRSHTGQFLAEAGGDSMSDRITREILQDFIDSKKKVDPRTKKNLLDAVKAMMTFGKSNRNVAMEWDEANHVIMPAVKPKKVSTYTAEELKKLLAAAPAKFQPILALAAFAGIRSSELELLQWQHIRLIEVEERDQIINIDIDVTEESGKRSITIGDTLRSWISGPFKLKGKLWSGTHDDFYRMQQKIARDAGVKWKQNALRHTCISARVAITRDASKVASESGNSVSVIKRHYLDLMPPSVAHAWFSVTPAVVHQYRKTTKEQEPVTTGEKQQTTL